MSEGKGWIKAHRSWLDNPVIMKDPDHVAVWVYLNLSATHKEMTADFGGKVITLMPGQLITGRDAIASRTGVNSYKVERVLKRLISAQLITQQTCSKGRLISLINWKSEQESAQPNAQQLHNDCTTTAHLQERKKGRREEYYEPFWDK